jgi:hypothetical protein
VFLIHEAHIVSAEERRSAMSESTLNEKNETLENILKSAVVVNWADLMRGRSGLIHIEYAFAPNGTLDYAKVLSSVKRGYWLLACTYWMSPSHDAGVHFDNGFESKGLANILEVVMQHQNLFGLPQNFGGQGMLSIEKPTEKESKAAADSIQAAIDRVNSPARQRISA